MDHQRLSARTLAILRAAFPEDKLNQAVGIWGATSALAGYSPVETGIRMLPLTATFVISAPLGGFTTERFGARPTVIVGMLLLIVAFLGLSGLQVDTPYSGQWPYFLMIGFAFGLIIVSTTEAIVCAGLAARGSRRCSWRL